MTPAKRWAGRTPRDAASLPSQLLVRNMRAYRSIRDLSQADLARAIARMGLGWTESIVGAAERGERPITTDELGALAVALGVTVPALLDPAGAMGALTTWVDLGGASPLNPDLARRLLTELGHDEDRARAVAQLVGTAPERPSPRRAAASGPAGDRRHGP